MKAFIGTAGWSISTNNQILFPKVGSHLERYARVFNAVEINSCFYKDHKADTYKRWADETPNNFSFSAKLSKHFIHDLRLLDFGDELKTTVHSMLHLGPKLKTLLVQLPPSLTFNKDVVDPFINELRSVFSNTLVLEPRHASWTSDEAIDLLAKYNISKVISDPEPCVLTKEQRTKINTVRYYRLHGSPEIYKSNYSEKFIFDLNRKVQISLQKKIPTWVIFDNTSYGYGIQNALLLKSMLSEKPYQESPHA